MLGAPINIVYEEGTAIGSGLTSAYAAITKVTVGEGFFLQDQMFDYPLVLLMIFFLKGMELLDDFSKKNLYIIYVDIWYQFLFNFILGKLSIAEALIPCDSSKGGGGTGEGETKHQIISLLSFSLTPSSTPASCLKGGSSSHKKKNPDLRLVYKVGF